MGLDRREVSRWEAAKYKLLSPEAVALQKVFEKNGVDFVNPDVERGPGVRWRRPGREDRLRSAQFRAARAMADLSIRELESFCGVNRNFVTRLETGQIGGLNLVTVGKLESAFARLGIELTPETEAYGLGVRWMDTNPQEVRQQKIG
ncbi:transcriptional regulator [Rhizobium ruizarguesonis]|uniref:transcriptional regulator n=1 Tax=Rhizobium ruizarguesonis TaxID=2081791 RepID=UPI001FE07EDD|nr:transcriptional regulator [Rhizobium ruizarguesonis]